MSGSPLRTPPQLPKAKRKTFKRLIVREDSDDEEVNLRTASSDSGKKAVKKARNTKAAARFFFEDVEECDEGDESEESSQEEEHTQQTPLTHTPTPHTPPLFSTPPSAHTRNPPPSVSQRFSTSGPSDQELAALMEEFDSEHRTQPAEKPHFGQRLDDVPPGDLIFIGADWCKSFGDALAHLHVGPDDRSLAALRRRCEAAASVDDGDAAPPSQKTALMGDSSNFDRMLALVEDAKAPTMTFSVARDVAEAMVEEKMVAKLVAKAKASSTESDRAKVCYWDPKRQEFVDSSAALERALRYYAETLEVEVQYRLDGHCGRLLAAPPQDNGRSVVYPIYMRGALRRFLMARDHLDLDVANAHVCFAYELCRMLGVGPLPFLSMYYRHREYVLRYLCVCSGCDREEAKQAMLVAMFGGNSALTSPFLEGFKEDLRAAVTGIKKVRNGYTTMCKKVKRLFPCLPSERNHSIKNAAARDMSYITCRMESVVILSAAQYLDKAGYGVASLVYDGLMVRKPRAWVAPAQSAEELCLFMAHHVHEQTGITVKFVEKDMHPTEKDYRWVGDTELANRLRQMFGEEPESPKLQPVDGPSLTAPAAPQHVKTRRVPDNMLGPDGDLHFMCDDQKRHLEPPEDEKKAKAETATNKLKRAVLGYAQQHSLFRTYLGHTVFAESETMARLLEVKFTSMLDLVNHVGQFCEYILEADVEKVAEELRTKAVSPGIFPFVLLGNTSRDDLQLSFAFEPAPDRWNFLDGQLVLSRLANEPDGDESFDRVWQDLDDTLEDIELKFYRYGVPEETQFIQYTVKGLPVHWNNWIDEDGELRYGVKRARAANADNFNRILMTQILDKDYVPEDYRCGPNGEPPKCEPTAEQVRSLYVIMAAIGRFFMPQNFNDRWEIFPFLFGESSVGKGSLTNMLHKLLPSFLSGDISNSGRQGLAALEEFIHREYVFCVEAQDFEKYVGLGDFKSMASSEFMNISRLYKGNFGMRWCKQLWLSGQKATALFKEDPAGAAARRTLAIWCRRAHAKSNYSVEQGLMEERFAVFSLCVRAYHLILHQLKGCKLLEWDLLPEFFKISKDRMSDMLSLGRRFFGHTQTFGVYKQAIRYVPWVMQPSDQGRKGWCHLDDLLEDIKLFVEADPLLRADSRLKDNWLSECRAALRPLYERVRFGQVERGDDFVWPEYDFGFIKDAEKHRCCKKHNKPGEGRALLGSKFCGCACVFANKEGSVKAIVNLQRLKGEEEIEKYFEKWQIEETL